MPRAIKNTHASAKIEKPSGKESAYLLLPWSCKHYPDYSEIEAYIPGGDWQTIAEIHDASGVDAEVLSNFIVRAVNKFEIIQDLAVQMAAALELCLACEGPLTWEAEQAADAILKHYRHRG